MNVELFSLTVKTVMIELFRWYLSPSVHLTFLTSDAITSHQSP